MNAPRHEFGEHAVFALALACVTSGGCAKTVSEGCASDRDCAEGVSCDLDTRRCLVPPCFGAAAGDDDTACGVIDCDELDDACRDYTDVTTARCAGDDACKAPNDAATCLKPADRCAPFACDERGAEPVCRSSCDTVADCAKGAACPAGVCCAGGWELYPIETAGDVGEWVRIATDAAGNAHAAWLDADLPLRVHAGSTTVETLGVWVTETVPPPDSGFWYGGSLLSLDVDDAGTRHILYHEENTGNAVYGVDSGSGWVATTIDLGGGGWQRGALAVSSDGLASIVVATGSSWAFQFRGAATLACGTVAEPTVLHAMAVDADGRAHFLSWNNGIRYFAQKTTCDPGNPMAVECCDLDPVSVILSDTMGGNAQARHSIAIDPISGDAHATVYQGQDGDLMHAVCDPSNCTTDAVDEIGDAGRYSAIVVGAGALHVAYYVGGDEDLRYATHASGTWRTYPIDVDGAVGEYASLARAPDGRLHAAYYDADAKDALYATLPPQCVPGE